MLRITDDIKLDFDDVLIIPQPSDLNSRSEVNLERTICMPNAKDVNPYDGYHQDDLCNAKNVSWTGVAVIASNMDTVGTMEMAKKFAKEKMLVALHKHYSEDQLYDFFINNLELWNNVFYTVGSNHEDFAKLARLRDRIDNYFSNSEMPDSYKANYSQFPKMICMDIANGYSKHFCEKVKYCREEFPWAIIMAGNVVTGNMTEKLIEYGADIVKVGIGGGAMCRTRIVAGVGVPQLSAIAECAFQAHGSPAGHICGDGGCRNPGDVSKAFAAGADFVMLGSMLGGTDACEGEWECDENGNKKSLLMYGMSSLEAQKKYNGGMKSHRTSEGRAVMVPYKGKIEDVIQDILGGVRSACTYVGARNLKDLPKCAKFARVNSTYNDYFERNVNKT